MIHYEIPKGCYNAGNIEDYAVEHFKGERETLIPPYTACRVAKKVENEDGPEFWLEVTKDNKNTEFNNYTY